MNESKQVLRVTDLEKTFTIGFFRKKVHAVCGIDFTVDRGEIFGLLGPNGAGKTTTIKCILRLIHPSKGKIQIFGLPPAHLDAARRIGYMPENPYVYQYLNPQEFLDLCGRLVGLSAAERRRRTALMIDKVGLSHAATRPIGKFSKGMMQRVGMAQALLHDPDFLVLDEPMSGLDPIGRKDVRDILLEQKRQGKTLLFTSHILSDVEMLCDRVVILREGKVVADGKIDDLLSGGERRLEIQLRNVTNELADNLTVHGELIHRDAGNLTLAVHTQAHADAITSLAIAGGAELLAMVPVRQTLESLFVQEAVKT